MTSCCNQQHEDIISELYYSKYTTTSFYYEHKQQKIFLIFGQTLFIIDSTNFVKICPQCKKYRYVYIHGTWPDVRASFDGKTDLPICAVVPGIEEFKLDAMLESEPSFGKFIYTLSTLQNNEYCTIIYCLNRNIEQSKCNVYQELSVDGKPATLCKTVDNKYIIIISSGEIIETETVYSTEPDCIIFKVGNGTLQYSDEDDIWKYTANPALKTKPAIHE
jgi:hypothetical protein